METFGSFTLHFGLKYEIIYQLEAIEHLFVFFQLDMFRAYTPIFRSNGCYSFFTYVAYGVLGFVWLGVGSEVCVCWWHTHSSGPTPIQAKPRTPYATYVKKL